MAGRRIFERARPLLAGGAVGLALFLAEGLLVLRSNAVGLKMDVRGPLAALLAAVRPALPWLLARVLFAYLLIGVGLGLAAWVLASCVVRPGRRRWLVWGAELLVLGALVCTARAIERPALFDDLPFARGWLRVLVDHGAPWEAWGALALFVLLQVGVWVAGEPRRRVRFAGSVVVLIGAFALLSRLPVQADDRGPLVILFGIDAFRPDRVEDGRHVAPNVERLLKDGTRFTHAYTPIAQTEPAWRAIVTARWPSRTGVRFPLTPHASWVSLPTFPAELQASGVETAFATDCSRFNYLGPESGFAERIEPPRGALNFLLEKLRFRLIGVFLDGELGSALLPELIDNRAMAGLYDPLAYAHRLADRLERQASRGQTFFAFHDTAAHFPGDPVYPFYRRYVSQSQPLERRLRMIFAPISKGSREPGGWTRKGEEALYDELLAQADAQLGIVLDSLRATGRYDEAWVIVFSDHGESFYEGHPTLEGATPEHGAQLGPEENRILLAVKPPRSFGRPKATVDALVRLIDVGPTILDALHAAPLKDADGASLLGLLRGTTEPPRFLYAETGYTHATPDVFDPDHFSSGPRGFDAYEILPDGAVQMTAKAAAGALREKDEGAFDGKGWLIRSPEADGGTKERCQGTCDPGLAAFLDHNR
jgi:arylsulfatase A-like enzyme